LQKLAKNATSKQISIQILWTNLLKNQILTKQISPKWLTESDTKQWDFVPIYENLRYSILPNGSLSITNVTRRESGFYMCMARNGFGPEVTKLIKLTVHGK